MHLEFKKIYIMAITRLKRKARRNKLTSKLRNQKLALESAKPVMKNIDVEAIKAEFKAASEKKETPKKETAPKAEAKVEVSEKEVKKASPKKTAAKKETAPKAEKKAAPKKETT